MVSFKSDFPGGFPFREMGKSLVLNFLSLGLDLNLLKFINV